MKNIDNKKLKQNNTKRNIRLINWIKTNSHWTHPFQIHSDCDWEQKKNTIMKTSVLGVYVCVWVMRADRNAMPSRKYACQTHIVLVEAAQTCRQSMVVWSFCQTYHCTALVRAIKLKCTREKQKQKQEEIGRLKPRRHKETGEYIYLLWNECCVYDMCFSSNELAYAYTHTHTHTETLAKCVVLLYGCLVLLRRGAQPYESSVMHTYKYTRTHTHTHIDRETLAFSACSFSVITYIRQTNHTQLQPAHFNRFLHSQWIRWL